MTRPYIGTKADGTREAFRAAVTPTTESHGATYPGGALGPFRTMHAARTLARPEFKMAWWDTITQAEAIAARAN